MFHASTKIHESIYLQNHQKCPFLAQNGPKICHRGDLQPVSPSNVYKHSLNHNYIKFHASTQFNESVSCVKSPNMFVFDLKWPKNGS